MQCRLMREKTMNEKSITDTFSEKPFIIDLTIAPLSKKVVGGMNTKKLDTFY